MRYQLNFPANRNDQDAQNVIGQYLTQEGFSMVMYKGEYVWKKGVGFLTAPQYVKATCQNGWVYLEAWIRFAILPGVYLGEMGLTGFFGAVPKKMLRDRVNMLASLLSQVPAQTR